MDAAPHAYSVGQYAELGTTIPSDSGGSVVSGTRGIIDATDLTQPKDDIYLVAFLRNERRTGESAWMREIELFLAKRFCDRRLSSQPDPARDRRPGRRVLCGPPTEAPDRGPAASS